MGREKKSRFCKNRCLSFQEINKYRFSNIKDEKEIIVVMVRHIGCSQLMSFSKFICKKTHFQMIVGNEKSIEAVERREHYSKGANSYMPKLDI